MNNQRTYISVQISCSFIGILLLCFFSSAVYSQSAYYSRYSPAVQLFERLEMKSGNLKNNVFLDIQPLERAQAAGFIQGLKIDSAQLTGADRYWLDYLASDNLPWSSAALEDSKKPILRHFYKSKANLYQVNDSGLHLFINPVLGLWYGREADSSRWRFRNTRGVEVRGSIDNKVGFYTFITENQVGFPAYVQDYITANKVVPGEGYKKPFKQAGYDFFTSRAYITFSPSKHIHLQFGNDQNFIGSGYRSLLLSDFSRDYLFLKVNTRIWRFHYQNLFAQFTDLKPQQVKPYPKKYGAFHYLSFDATKFLNFGLFEGITFFDSKRNGRGFDFTYLNPVIFYRSAEQNLGSGDNSVLGANIDVLPMKHLKLYAQLLFDEFKIHELLSDSGWWGNKYAFQLGFKWIDIFGLPNVDWQAEYNLVRPYTYTSDSSGKSYVHFNQALAHPLGANFRELVNIVRINSFGPLNITLKHFFIQQGRDTAGRNWGSNILYSYNTREQEYHNTLLQGIQTNIQLFEADISYQLRHNLFIDANVLYRTESGDKSRNTLFAGAGLRWNFPYKNYEF